MKFNPRSSRSNLAVAVLLLSILPNSAYCQEQFEPIPKGVRQQYQFDFARNLFASAEAERADRAKLFATLTELETLKGKVGSSADNLLRAMELSDRVKVQFYRHYTYLYLRYAVDTRDEKSLEESSTLDSEVDTRTAFLQQELIRLGDRSLSSFAAEKPSLKPYLPAIEAITRKRPHVLSLAEEELLRSTAPLTSGWQSELYDKLRAGQLNAAQSASATTPESRFKQLYGDLFSQRDLYASILIKLATAGERVAHLRHFADAPSAAYFSRYWTRAEVDELLEQISRRTNVYQRYQRLQSDHIKQTTGAKEVNVWDVGAVVPGVPVPRYTIDQARQIIRGALAPLGPEYGRELDALLDPANGRMDIVPGARRKRGGFSKGFIGTDSLFFSSGFAGSYNDVRVLAHESTHAVHRQLMNHNRVLPTYAEGPHYLFESFAIFSEFLLPDFLYSRETDPLRQQYYLEQFLNGKGMEIFVVAPEVEVEHAVYDAVRQGTLKGANDLDALTRRIYGRYSIWPAKHDELKGEWMKIWLMYEDPFYDINYVFGALLALKFYQLYRQDPQHFVPRYIALLRNGFNAPPDVLLKRFMGIDLRDPQLVSEAVKVIEEKVDLLERSYHK